MFIVYPASARSVENEKGFQLYKVAKGADITFSDGVVTLHKITQLGNVQTRNLMGNEVIQTYASTIIYSSKTVNNKSFKSITSITGGFRGSGSGFSLTSGVIVTGQFITFGQCGMTESNGYCSYTGDDRFDGDERNWTTTFNFKSWLPVFPSAGATMSCKTTICLGGRSRWEHTFVNKAF